MLNSSQVPDFIMAAYVDVGMLKYLYFVLLLCLYVVTVGANVVLLLVICVNRSLHEPMYLFLCSLFVNEVYGSTGLLPFLLLHILSDTHTVPAALCFLQIFCLYTYVNVEFYNLAVMSYDRYLAICCPLQYRARMTSSRVAVLLALTWLLPVVVIMVMISLNASLQLCGNVIEQLYCSNFSLVKLACYDTTVNNIYGLVYTFTVLTALTSLNVCSYVRILRVCFSSSRQTRQKAISTCWPHLASLINFSCGCFLEILQSRFNMSGVPNSCRIFLSLYFLVFQPLLSPALYGLNLSKVRSICKSLLH